MSYLSSDEKLQLLKIAREAIVARLNDLPRPVVVTDSEKLRGNGAAFVTLKIDGQLRGCIGYTEAFQPLLRTVQECAVAAAFADPRFHPLLPQECDNITVDISVLTPLVLATSPDEIEVGKHGIAIEARGRHGLLLPQVATEYNWDRETFLEQTCYKAGLPRNAWREPTTKIYLFEAEVFAEEDFA